MEVRVLPPEPQLLGGRTRFGLGGSLTGRAAALPKGVSDFYNLSVQLFVRRGLRLVDYLCAYAHIAQW